jgi:hypothetical protein
MAEHDHTCCYCRRDAEHFDTWHCCHCTRAKTYSLGTFTLGFPPPGWREQ